MSPKSGEPLTRTERLLALLVVESLGSMTLKDKAVKLASVGLSHNDIAEMLATTPQSIKQSLYEARHARGRTTRKGVPSKKLKQ
jgi:hypothetical protein